MENPQTNDHNQARTHINLSPEFQQKMRHIFSKTAHRLKYTSCHEVLGVLATQQEYERDRKKQIIIIERLKAFDTETATDEEVETMLRDTQDEFGYLDGTNPQMRGMDKQAARAINQLGNRMRDIYANRRHEHKQEQDHYQDYYQEHEQEQDITNDHIWRMTQQANQIMDEQDNNRENEDSNDTMIISDAGEIVSAPDSANIPKEAINALSVKPPPKQKPVPEFVDPQPATEDDIAEQAATRMDDIDLEEDI